MLAVVASQLSTLAPFLRRLLGTWLLNLADAHYNKTCKKPLSHALINSNLLLWENITALNIYQITVLHY